MNWSVVPATEADIPGVTLIAKRNKFISGFSRMHFLLKDREVLLVTKASDGTVAGFCQGIHTKKRGYSSIYNFGTHPNYMRQGIGQALLQGMVAAAPVKRIRLVVDETNDGAISFYLRSGFKEIGRKKSRDGHLLIQMEWSL